MKIQRLSFQITRNPSLSTGIISTLRSTKPASIPAGFCPWKTSSARRPSRTIHPSSATSSPGAPLKNSYAKKASRHSTTRQSAASSVYDQTPQSQSGLRYLRSPPCQALLPSVLLVTLLLCASGDISEWCLHRFLTGGFTNEVQILYQGTEFHGVKLWAAALYTTHGRL